MIDSITTIAAARKYRYNRWGGNPNGSAFVEGRCVYEVHDNDRGGMFHQCARAAAAGPDSLYCTQHDPAAVKARSQKRTADYHAKLRREDLQCDLRAVSRTAHLLKAEGKYEAAEACTAIARRIREELSK